MRHISGRHIRSPLRLGSALAWVAGAFSAVVVASAVITLALSAAGLMPLVGQPALRADAFVAVAPDLLVATRESLLIAGASSILAAIIGMSVALAIVANAPGSRMLAALAAAPIPIAHIVGAASFALLLSDAGLFNRISGASTSSWPALVAGPWPVASVAAFAWKESAFVALVVTASLGAGVRNYSEVAAMLGAGPLDRLRRVVIPLATPALLGSTIIVFLFTLGSYEVVWLLGQAYPEPLPVTAYRLFTSVDLQARPQAAAVALITVLLALAAAAATVPLLRRLGTAR